MKYVVTGGAGFIGSNLVKFLIKSGHDVKVIDNFVRGENNNLSSLSEKITLKRISIADFDKLEYELKDIDGVFHHAALTSVFESFQRPEEYEKINVIGTKNIFKLAQKVGFKVIFASSASVYGDVQKTPISEDTKRNPINPYGLTKLKNELLAEKYTASGTKIIGLRYFNVYGNNQNFDYAGVITKFLEKINLNYKLTIFGNGFQKRDFVYVNDIARANVKAMESSTEKIFFNIGTGIATSILDLAKMMIKLSGKNLNFQFDSLPEGDIQISQASTNLAKNSLEWQFETNLEKGLSNFFK